MIRVATRRRKLLIRWLRSGAGARAFPGLILPRPRTHYSMFHRCEVGPGDVWCQWEEEIGAYFPDSLADEVPAPRGQVLHRGVDRDYRIGAALMAALGIG